MDSKLGIDQLNGHPDGDICLAMGKIGAVIVTYNRLNDLKLVLQAYDDMITPPSFLVVVDNASASDTAGFLASWAKEPSKFKKIVKRMSRNLGGAGGFKAGIDISLSEGAQWIFVADDDAVPETNIFEAFSDGLREISCDKSGSIAALCSTVLTANGIDTAHRRRVKVGLFSFKEEAVQLSEYKNRYFELDELSYVGSLLNADAVRTVGSTCGEFFIFHDDTDHSLRLEKYGAIYCIPGAITNHKVTIYDGPNDSWRAYYDARNRLAMIRRNCGSSCFYAQFIFYWIKRCSILASFVKHRSDLERAIAKRAASDALHDKLGLCADFTPGQTIRP